MHYNRFGCGKRFFCFKLFCGFWFDLNGKYLDKTMLVDEVDVCGFSHGPCLNIMLRAVDLYLNEPSIVNHEPQIIAKIQK